MPLDDRGVTVSSLKHLEYFKAVARAGLNYVTDVFAGISRRRSGKGWSYADADGLRIADPVMRKPVLADDVNDFCGKSAAATLRPRIFVPGPNGAAFSGAGNVQRPARDVTCCAAARRNGGAGFSP